MSYVNVNEFLLLTKIKTKNISFGNTKKSEANNLLG